MLRLITLKREKYSGVSLVREKTSVRGAKKPRVDSREERRSERSAQKFLHVASRMDESSRNKKILGLSRFFRLTVAHCFFGETRFAKIYLALLFLCSASLANKTFLTTVKST